MQPRPRYTLLAATMAGLLVLHLGLLLRTLGRGDVLLASILGVAVILFAGRLVVYGRRAFRAPEKAAPVAAPEERRSLRARIVVGVGLLLLHGTLLVILQRAGEVVAVVLLSMAVVVFLHLLVTSVLRYRALIREQEAKGNTR